MGFSHENDNSLADALWFKNNFVFRPLTLCGSKTILHFIRRHSVAQKQFCFSSSGTLWLKNNFVSRPQALCGAKRGLSLHIQPTRVNPARVLG